ncbi:Conidiation protein 6-domain-containing protein [Triangularia verruculosa]|uniref:Conidiation protein 6-domain-containing protein n=1 Tax=Triangularia verruculosa TaxID=2587418 RepID=A0AAN7AS03_9PEZI|nr:Conidiation protein 6-domain-containing protein [Triangularia verruculosa]
MPELRENPKQRDVVGDAAQENALQAPEEISNQARGHKANLSNPNTSEESKENSRQKLEELGGENAFFSKDSK